MERELLWDELPVPWAGPPVWPGNGEARPIVVVPGPRLPQQPSGASGLPDVSRRLSEMLVLDSL